MAIRYKYTGSGEYLPGIPARDLTDEDLAALTDAAKDMLAAHVAEGGTEYEDPDEAATVRASRIYEPVGGKGPAPAASEAEE